MLIPPLVADLHVVLCLPVSFYICFVYAYLVGFLIPGLDTTKSFALTVPLNISGMNQRVVCLYWNRYGCSAKSNSST